MDRHTRIITRTEVESVLTVRDALPVVEAAFRSYGQGECVMPSKVYLTIPAHHGDFRAMPAYMKEPYEAAGLKWVNVHPDNAGGPLPSVMGVLVYSDPATGFPLAVMDATCITRMRTGAAGGVAAKYLSREDSSTVALAGCGAQAITQLQAVGAVRHIAHVYAYDARSEAADALCRRLTALGFDARPARDLATAVSNADIVVTTTPVREPIVHAEWIKAGSHINAMGADAPGKQELDFRVLQRARVFIDDWNQASHSGEINVPLKQGLFKREQVAGTLGEVVAGKSVGRTAPSDITVFDSTGLAIQDIATARYVYDECVRRGIGIEVDLV